MADFSDHPENSLSEFSRRGSGPPMFSFPARMVKYKGNKCVVLFNLERTLPHKTEMK